MTTLAAPKTNKEPGFLRKAWDTVKGKNGPNAQTYSMGAGAFGTFAAAAGGLAAVSGGGVALAIVGTLTAAFTAAAGLLGTNAHSEAKMARDDRVEEARVAKNFPTNKR